jgi:L-threonylcarbamoyladenylate synthase
MELLTLTQKNFHETVIIAASILKKGGVIVAPTDTVYGLLGDATNSAAVKKVYLIKRRPAGKSLPLFVKSMAMAKKYAAVPEKQQHLLEEKWPGKFTAVLRKKPGGKIFGSDGKTVALRIPHHQFVASLLEIVGLPLTGTSANISGQPASVKIDEVLAQFYGLKDLPDLVINAGDLPESKPSTIVDLTQRKPTIIRD